MENRTTMSDNVNAPQHIPLVGGGGGGGVKKGVSEARSAQNEFRDQRHVQKTRTRTLRYTIYGVATLSSGTWDDPSRTTVQ